MGLSRSERLVLVLLTIAIVGGRFLRHGCTEREAFSIVADSTAALAPADGVGDEASESLERARSESEIGRTGSGPLDLNRAEMDELIRLPGIGPVKAKAIVDRRNELGGFASVEDLIEVSGIGPKTLERLSGLVTIARKSPPGEEAR